MHFESLTKPQDHWIWFHKVIDESTRCHAGGTSLSLQPHHTLQPRQHWPLDMPWKYNLSPVWLQYSWDLKKWVVYQPFMLMKSTTEIAINLDMPVCVVQCIWTNWQEIGDVCKDQTHLGRAPLMSQSSGKTCAGFSLVSESWHLDHTGIANDRAYCAVSRYLHWWNPRAAWKAAQHYGFSSHHLQNSTPVGNHIQEGVLCSCVAFFF